MFFTCNTTDNATGTAPAAPNPSDPPQTEKIKVIVDCDNSMGSFFWEVDDGLVITYLLHKPEADLLGITTTFGNRTYDHKYTERLLKQAGRTDVPLYKGEQTPDSSPTEAAHFLAETVARYPGQVSIIAAGPVGNLAAAAAIDPDFFQNVKQIACMGGRLEDLVLGKREVKELNLSADYQATYAMLQSGCPITIMTGQTCRQAPFSWDDLKKLDNFPARWRRYLRHWLITHRVGLGLNHFFLWDLLPTVYTFHPEYFQDNLVPIASTPQDLQTGLLVPGTSDQAPIVNVPQPGAIIDLDAFYDDLFTQWNQQGKKLH